MKKKYVLLLMTTFYFILTGFIFPKDIGLIDKNDLESTKINLLQYFQMSDNLEYDENLSAFTNETLYLFAEKNTNTLNGVVINNITSQQAEQMLLDVGIGINNAAKAVLAEENPLIAHTFVIEDKVVLFQNLINISWIDKETPFKISIAFSEEMAIDYLEQELNELNAQNILQ